MSKTISAHDLNIYFDKDDEHALFKWLVASFLMGKRIQADIAADAYRVIVEKHRRDTPRKLAGCTHRELVKLLGEARYTRYDESTAERLSKLSKTLNEEYAGDVLNIRRASEDRAAFEKRLMAFDGIGPKTVEIFMRDARTVFFDD
jgi:endonuclease III